MASHFATRWLLFVTCFLPFTLTAQAKRPAPQAPAAATTSAPGQPSPAPATAYHSLVDVLKNVPAESFRKLQDASTFQTGITEINSYLAQNVKGKPAEFHLKIAVAKPVSEQRNKFRVRMVDRPVMTWHGGEIMGRLWAYFPAESVPPNAKASVNHEILVSGLIGRCEITDKDHLELNVDLQESKLTSP